MMEHTLTKCHGHGTLDAQRAARRDNGRSRHGRSPSLGHVDRIVTKRTRSRTGCLNCRRRRKKCDEKKPTCSKCHSQGEKCEWDAGVTFRYSSLSLGSRSWRKMPGHLNGLGSESRRYVVNPTTAAEGVTGSSGSSRDQSRRPTDFNSGDAFSTTPYIMKSSPATLLSGDCPSIVAPLEHSPASVISDLVYTEPTAPISQPSAPLLDLSTELCSPGKDAINPALGSTVQTGQYAVFNTNNNPARTELDALDYLLSNPKNDSLFSSVINENESRPWPSDPSHELVPADQLIAESPDAYATYYPNLAYKELHTVLHHHMVETARSITRQGTPEATTQNASTNNGSASSQYTDGATLGSSASPVRPLAGTKLTSRRELELWQNYLQEVAVWLDMFDIERHFQLKIPMMAKSSAHLHYSILALSARQMERREPDKPYTESLTLYQEAIELIVQELRSLDTAVIASCVLLCVLEMMSSSPKAWGRHLDGCAMLLQAAGINGTVGGVRQAIFWCFARMDVWGGFLSDTLTRIPTSHWFTPSGSMSSAVNQFRTSPGGADSYANYAVFLCATVVNVLSDRNAPFAGHRGNASELKTSFSARWRALFDLLEDWYNRRPEEMQPLMSCPATWDDHEHPFPIILHGTSPAINGNQLYHASMLLMLQEKPKDIRLGKGHRSIQWHARQVCGIAASNNIHGPWINALQPLWIAGKVMSHPTEHRAILDILTRIEKETGWATAWRAEDLIEYWGEAEE